MTSDPSLSEVLQEVASATAALLHTSLPGVVKSYNRTEQTATVRLAVRGRRKDPKTGAISTFERSPLVRVPVVWPGGSAGSLTFDLLAGDPVVVIFAERDISKWLTTGAVPSDPVDFRRHDLSDAYCIPQVRDYTSPLGSDAVLAGAAVLKGSDIRLGSANANQFIALAPLVLAELNKLTSWMASMKAVFDAHTHTVATAPGESTTPVLSALPTPAPPAPSVDSPASSKVRSE